MFQELAEAGVIIVKAGGNRGNYISQTSSSFNTFGDLDRYDENLVNNYFTYAVDAAL